MESWKPEEADSTIRDSSSSSSKRQMNLPTGMKADPAKEQSFISSHPYLGCYQQVLPALREGFLRTTKAIQTIPPDMLRGHPVVNIPSVKPAPWVIVGQLCQFDKTNPHNYFEETKTCESPGGPGSLQESAHTQLLLWPSGSLGYCLPLQVEFMEAPAFMLQTVF